MRKVFFAGAAVAVVIVAADRIFKLLNEPNDLSVAAGYFLLLALVSALAGLGAWLWRRL
jgi:hypothetical protein